MAVIDQDKLLADINCWLPDANTLSDNQLAFIAQSVTAEVGDDNENYGEVLCKSLKACAEMNDAMAAVDDGNITRERVGNVETYYDSKAETWKAYITSLPTICSLFGYELAGTIGMKVSTGNVNGGKAQTELERCEEATTGSAQTSSFFI